MYIFDPKTRSMATLSDAAGCHARHRGLHSWELRAQSCSFGGFNGIYPLVNHG